MKKKKKKSPSESNPIERASHSESLCWVFWHCCRWETRRCGSEARWSGTQESPEFRTSSNCGCGVEEVLTFYWFINTHASLGSYTRLAPIDIDIFFSLIWLKYIRSMLRILEQILRVDMSLSSFNIRAFSASEVIICPNNSVGAIRG